MGAIAWRNAPMMMLQAIILDNSPRQSYIHLADALNVARS
jgi:hypothetical protein